MKKTAKFTRHAQARSKQRALPPILVDLLMHYGQSRNRKGADVLEFSRETEQWLRQQLAQTLAHWDSRRNVYAVLGDGGSILTIGHKR
jgi:hypothetical protein